MTYSRVNHHDDQSTHHSPTKFILGMDTGFLAGAGTAAGLVPSTFPGLMLSIKHFSSFSGLLDMIVGSVEGIGFPSF